MSEKKKNENNLKKIRKRLRIISLYNERPFSEINNNKYVNWNIKTKNHYSLYHDDMDAKIIHKKKREGD